MTFSYRHTGLVLFGSRLQINLFKTGFMSFRKILMDIRVGSQVWQTYSVHIGQLKAGYQVQISGNDTINTNTRPYIDIDLDNIKFVDCDPTATVTTSTILSCDFENGTCGWSDWNMGSTNKIDWVSAKLL